MTPERQGHVPTQTLHELATGGGVVAADDHQTRHVGLFGQSLHAAYGSRGRGPTVTSVEHEHERGVQPLGEVDGARALDALPAVEHRARRYEHHQIGLLRPVVVQLRRQGMAVQCRVDHARGLGGAFVEKSPEGNVEADQHRPHTALLAQTGQQRAGHQVKRRARLNTGDDEARDRHRRPPPGPATIEGAADGWLFSSGAPFSCPPGTAAKRAWRSRNADGLPNKYTRRGGRGE